MRGPSRFPLGLAAVSLATLLAACSGGSATQAPAGTQAPAPSATVRVAPGSPSPAPATPTSGTRVTPGSRATSTAPTRSTPTVAATPAPAGTATTGPSALQEFFLEVTSPKNESVVKTAFLAVNGRTVADAVVSVNGVAAAVGADGSFSATVALEEGPNSIEVLANDFQGHSASNVISVIYTP